MSLKYRGRETHLEGAKPRIELKDIIIINNLCTDKMRSYDTREHFDWLRVILVYKSVKIFNSAMILK